MLTLYIADAEKDVSMKNLSPKEAIAILSDMKIDIPVPKAAVTQRKRNTALDMAISALNCSEIPNNSDTIYRQQAIEVLRNRWLKTRNYEGIGEDIAEECEIYLKSLPSVQPERKTGRWIPVSERLPEDEYVLISKKPTKISGSKWSVAIAIRTADPRSRKIQWRDSGFGVIQDDKVLAWMPLPEPYQEGGKQNGTEK